MGFPELRYAFLEDTWVLLAPTRGGRPHDFPKTATTATSPDTCPFEPGREHLTPPEVFALRPPGSRPNGPGWRVRVVPNKFPAVQPEGRGSPFHDDLYRAMPGVGYHEVIIDTPDHHHHAFSWSIDDWTLWLQVVQQRMQALGRDPRIRYVQVFKNHGRASGASLAHPHTQVLALPVFEGPVARRWQQMAAFYRARGRCYLCQVLEHEIHEGRRVVYENRDYLVYCPFAPRFAYEMRIVPKGHNPDVLPMDEAARITLAEALYQAFQRLHRLLGDPPFNLILHSAPPAQAGDMAAFGHGYLEILPRLGTQAGLELGTGYAVNAVPPETAAAQLRESE